MRQQLAGLRAISKLNQYKIYEHFKMTFFFLSSYPVIFGFIYSFRCNRQKVLPEKKYSRGTFFLGNKYSPSTYYPVKKHSRLGKNTPFAIRF